QVEHQRRLRRQGFQAAAEQRPQQGDDDQQEDQVQQETAGGVEAAPERAETAAQRGLGLGGHRDSVIFSNSGSEHEFYGCALTPTDYTVTIAGLAVERREIANRPANTSRPFTIRSSRPRR